MEIENLLVVSTTKDGVLIGLIINVYSQKRVLCVLFSKFESIINGFLMKMKDVGLGHKN